ncbi:hypothetical protein KY290_033649 [Solanum tuberosum]|uniref:Uncharacterized protein n=1 Tax=Solanum tuberosum TaxID=4113 RepID=A0ABQ7U0Y3_SOLTU|nr:hypothetical protein KY289_033020 [Solanum tuberosum]KAH0644720.1 hypothetical protein KY284_032604 [Solanum tuberosum]KAH0647661.1 hypothetical protein KY285_032909 [Solanum tuberosum]KAH0740606.1 hypothetical protein KY290_033649 [Solanum tuberosum]
MLNDEFDVVDMNNHDDEIGKDEVSDFESNNPPTPIVGSYILCSSQSSCVNDVRDDETSFYKGMTFKNKEELAVSLKITCLKKDFRLKKVINSHTVMAALRAQYGADFGNLIYEYSSPYYSVEKYIMAYCEEIHSVPPEDSWIVPLDIIERIPLPYVDPSKPRRRRYKRRRGVGESFPTRKNKCSVCRDFGHKKTTCPNRNAP